MLAMTPTAVKVRLHRARQALSTLLRKRYAQPAVTHSRAQHPTGNTMPGDPFQIESPHPRSGIARRSP